MFNLFLTCAVCVFSVLVTVDADYQYGKYPPCEPKYQYPSVCDGDYGETYSPVNIKTSKCYPVSLSCLKFTVFEPSCMTFKNSKSGKIYGFQYDTTMPPAMVTGGPCGNNTYYLANCNWGWDNSLCNTHSWNLEDGVGCPCNIQLQWYKKDYGTRDDAAEHRDGLFETTHQCAVHKGKVDNPHYHKFDQALKNITLVNSSCTMASKDFLYWILSSFQCDHPYYCYPGARPNGGVGGWQFNTISCSSSVYSALWMSDSQFKTLTGMQTIFKQLMPKVYPVYELGDRPCVQVEAFTSVEKCETSFVIGGDDSSAK